jgi:ABC-type multidrug transport system ATPase subunit
VSDIEFISNNIVMMKKGKIVGIDAPENLVKSVRGKVAEVRVNEDKLPKMQGKYKIGNVFRADGQTFVRVVGDDFSEFENPKFVIDHLNLEDVYLYYLDN